MSAYTCPNGGDFNVNLGTSFPAAIFYEIESLALMHGLPKAKVLRELALRGLAAYRRDGSLTELLEVPESSSTAIMTIAVNNTDIDGGISESAAA